MRKLNAICGTKFYKKHCLRTKILSQIFLCLKHFYKLKMSILNKSALFTVRGSRPILQSYRELSNKSAIFTRTHRLIYTRLYPTALVLPDGASVNIRFPEPRKIIRLPLDLDTLTEAERKERLERRKPKKKVVIEEEIKDSFNAKKYLKFVKKK